MATSATDLLIPLPNRSASASASTSSFSDQPAPVTHSKTNRIPFFAWVLLLGLVATTAISIFLVACKDRTFTGNPYHFVFSKGVIITGVHQVVSHLLGSIHVSVLTTGFNISTRKWFVERAVSLDRLKWWSSMCVPKIDISLPRCFILALVACTAFATLPAAIWASATTPIITTQIQRLNFSIPQFGPDPEGHFWNKSTSQSDPVINRTVWGSFSYNPVRNLVGSMLDEASLATSPNASFQAHRKLDNSGFLFHGRSYGIGASIGLGTLAKNDVQQYSFFEDGYLSNITCWYNTSMEFHVSLAQQSSKGNWPSIYTACGDISDGSFECLPFPGLGDNEIVAMLGNPHEGHSQWGIATGIDATRYANLNQTTCEAVFYPMTFNVSVDAVQKIINVTATGNAAKDIDPSSTGPGPANGQLSINIAQEMGLIVQVSNSDQFSPFGNALISNVVNTNLAKNNGFLPQSLTDSQMSLMGIESALEAMVDDILLAFSSAQFMIAGQVGGGIKQTTMNATVAAIRIGDPLPIYTIAGFNAFVLLLFVVSAIRNRGWKTLPIFDYQDLKSVVIGSSSGGRDIAAAVQRTCREGQRWNADPGDRVAGRTMVQLVQNGQEGPMIKKYE